MLNFNAKSHSKVVSLFHSPTSQDMRVLIVPPLCQYSIPSALLIFANLVVWSNSTLSFAFSRLLGRLYILYMLTMHFGLASMICLFIPFVHFCVGLSFFWWFIDLVIDVNRVLKSLKLSPTNLSIRQWISLATFLTVVFVKWWFSLILIPSTFINCNSIVFLFIFNSPASAYHIADIHLPL